MPLTEYKLWVRSLESRTRCAQTNTTIRRRQHFGFYSDKPLNVISMLINDTFIRKEAYHIGFDHVVLALYCDGVPSHMDGITAGMLFAQNERFVNVQVRFDSRLLCVRDVTLEYVEDFVESHRQV